MSMTGSNPTSKTATPEELRGLHGSKSISMLGSCFSDAGDRVDLAFCPEAHEYSVKVSAGSNPTVDFAKFTEWGHRDHGITHCGALTSTKGSADVYYCQKDNQVCFDTKS